MVLGRTWIPRSSFLRELARDYFPKECVDCELIIPASACDGVEVRRLQNAGKSKSNRLVQLSCVCMQLKTLLEKGSSMFSRWLLKIGFGLCAILSCGTT